MSECQKAFGQHCHCFAINEIHVEIGEINEKLNKLCQFVITGQNQASTSNVSLKSFSNTFLHSSTSSDESQPNSIQNVHRAVLSQVQLSGAIEEEKEFSSDTNSLKCAQSLNSLSSSVFPTLSEPNIADETTCTDNDSIPVIEEAKFEQKPLPSCIESDASTSTAQILEPFPSDHQTDILPTPISRKSLPLFERPTTSAKPQRSSFSLKKLKETIMERKLRNSKNKADEKRSSLTLVSSKTPKSNARSPFESVCQSTTEPRRRKVLKRNKLYCKLCKRMITDDWYYHVAQKHVKEPCLICHICGYCSRWNLGNMKNHFRTYHPGQALKLSNKHDQTQEQIYEIGRDIID